MEWQHSKNEMSISTFNLGMVVSVASTPSYCYPFFPILQLQS